MRTGIAARSSNIGLSGEEVIVTDRGRPVAIGIEVGWILVVELIVSGMSAEVADYLPGGTISALVAGGTTNLAWLTALVLVGAYLSASLGIASTRRRAQPRSSGASR